MNILCTDLHLVEKEEPIEEEMHDEDEPEKDEDDIE